ncbi:MAG TPA: DUF6049 family protein [Pseudonocardia sp.]
MRPVAALAAVAVAVLTALLFGGPAEAATPGGLRLELSDVSPRVVTADGPTTLTVIGTLRNDGLDPVTDLAIRVQRSNPLTTEGQVRDALDGAAATDATAPQFTPLADVLEPGAQVAVNLTVPLRGSSATGLALGTTGVDELLVNVNGTPARGTRARLAAARMLLPVLGLPGATTSPVRTAAPAPLTVLYPIADVPHRLSTIPGAPVLLDDDTLAASFAPTGRLGGLVAALAQRAPLSSPVRSAVCLAIDPDLVETASVMSQGYQFLGPDGVPRAGAGAAAAGQWLAQLTAVAKGGCVVALPYADADLVALRRGGLTDTASQAVVTGRQILSTLLQTAIATDVVWPADGLVDTSTLDVIEAAGGRSLLLSADSVDGKARSGVVPLAGRRHPMAALLTDPLLSSAATGPSRTPTTPEPGAAATAESLAGNDGPLASQDLIGALSFRATAATPLVVAPPHNWRVEGTGAADLLDAVGTLITGGEVTPAGLTDTLAGVNPAAPAVQADPPVEMPLISGAAIAGVAAAVRDLADLRTAVVTGAGVGITPDQLFAPLDLGVLRPASAARRGSPTDAQSAASIELSRVDAVRNSIRVLEPPNPYSLGTSDAPLPITVANALPVTVRVRVQIVGTSGLRVAPIDVQQIPPLGRRQVSVNAQVTRAGQFTVEAEVRTPAGGALGPPSRLRVRSTAYGTITAWLTAIAGALLVVLTARRIWRRVRGDQARQTARVDPTPPPTEDLATGPTDRLPLPPTLLPHMPPPHPRPPTTTTPRAPHTAHANPAQAQPAGPMLPSHAAPPGPPVSPGPPVQAHPVLPSHAAPSRPPVPPVHPAPQARQPVVTTPDDLDVPPTERLPRPPPPRHRL